MLNKFLFRPIDNTALIVFRIFFGFLLFAECIGAIFTGWVKHTFIEPQFTFTFIGFEWLQPLPGFGMYWYYAIMGVLGLFVMVGYRYKISLLLFTLMWSATYLMQKSSYNNHYYLLILIAGIMLFLPAHRYASVDVKQHRVKKATCMPAWCNHIIVAQLFIVYTYAAIAKLYPDWLNGTVVKILMKGKEHYFLIGSLLQQPEVQFFITYGGIIFDALIIPALLFKPTRKWAFFSAIFFHLFNSVVFQIGIFPYLALAFTVFFFEPETIRTLFLKNKARCNQQKIAIPSSKNIIIGIGALYLAIQVLLPLRHWFIKGDVLWTEEGHRMSWRMMLRAKSGYISFKVVDKNTKQETIINPGAYLTKKQQYTLAGKPDVIWQFAQFLKKEYAKKNQDVAVFALGKVSVNGSAFKPLINPEVDLASKPFNHFAHNNWILTYKNP